MTDAALHAPAFARPKLGLRPSVIAGLLGLALLVLAFGGWAGLTHISGAVIAHGEVVVQGKPKVVQSLDGGVAREILVKDGDTVARGQLMLRLDPTLVQTNLGIARTKLAAALARKARLEAEQSGRDSIDFHYPDMPFPLPDTSAEEAGQRRIFDARRAVIEGSRDRLAERLMQFDSQISGLSGQLDALAQQIKLVADSIKTQKGLAHDGLARQSQINDLMGRRAELEGQLASLDAQRAALANSRQDAEIETLQSERSFMEQVVTDLRQANSDVETLMLEIITRSAELERTEIRAPSNGIVNELAITTQGGVVAPGQTILHVVPTDDGMEFDLKVDPRAIDQVHPGQMAQLTISSFDPQSIPKLTAEVTTISAAAVTDPRSGLSYYRVGLKVTPEELARLDGMRLVPGMQIEAYLKTADRSVLTYLLQPVEKHLQKAFRE